MAIKDAVIYDNILELIESRANVSDTRFKYTVELITPTGTISCRKVHTIDITRDFISRYSDYITTVVSVSRLEYDNYVYPGREDLRVRLTIEGVHDKTSIAGGEKASKLYRGKLTETINDSLTYGDTSFSDDTAKAQELKDFGLQLIDLTLEKLKVKDVSGVVRDTSPEDLLYVVMSDDGTNPMSVHKPDKIKNINQLIIKDGLSIAEFPAWLQKYGGGVYNDNLGFYVYNSYLYIYPLFNLTPQVTRRKVVLCSVGPGQLEGVDNTYYMQPGKLSILSAGKVEVTDTTEKLESEHGNAVRFTSPNFLQNAITHENGVTTATGEGYKVHGEHKDTINNSRVHNLVTANPFYEVSRISSNRGVRASFNWDNANPSLILPNTEITVLFKSGEKIRSLKGMIVGLDFQSTVGENEGLEGTHSGRAIIHTVLDKDEI